MKRFALSLSLPVLGALAFAMACSDTMSPDPHSALRPGTPNPALQGNLPPPPTATAINITVSSALPVTGAFTGVYFGNPSVESAAAATDVGDESLLSTGTAWLRLDNTQTNGSTASANARFSRTDQKMSGMGTLVIAGDTIRIDQVISFGANPDCTASGVVCASIVFTATVNGVSGHTGTAQAFDREFCRPVTKETETGTFIVFVCGS
jgi:hypothetical protein